MFLISLSGLASSNIATVTIVVESVNDFPTLAGLSDLTLDEDAAEQTVNLSGITAGGGETQPLRVITTSSNTDLIANPVVIYTTAETTGTLTFTPVSDANGSAVITVTVEDAGLDGDLNETDDNGITTREFQESSSKSPTAKINLFPLLNECLSNQTRKITEMNGFIEVSHIFTTFRLPYTYTSDLPIILTTVIKSHDFHLWRFRTPKKCIRIWEEGGSP